MSKILISLIIGLIAAIIDVVPMIIKRLDLKYILSAFTMWIVMGLLVYEVNYSKFSTVNGLITALLVYLPMSFLIFKLDKSAIIQVSVTTIFLGCLVGYFSGVLI